MARAAPTRPRLPPRSRRSRTDAGLRESPPQLLVSGPGRRYTFTRSFA